MSESRIAFIALAEEDPELRPYAPLFRVILEAPEGSLSVHLSLMEIWERLKADRRALLAMTLDGSLKVDEIASFARVHRRTLYKSETFKDFRSRIRAKRPGSRLRGEKSPAGDFDAWEDD